jgi:hypothetical protein
VRDIQLITTVCPYEDGIHEVTHELRVERGGRWSISRLVPDDGLFDVDRLAWLFLHHETELRTMLKKETNPQTGG